MDSRIHSLGATAPEAFDYVATLFAQEDEFLQSAKMAAQQQGVEGMMISPPEGKLLATLLRIHNSKKVVEIGGLTGYSALWMARALPEGGALYSFELDPERAEISRGICRRAGLGERVHHIVGNAIETLPSIEKFGPFDAVFIDANKGAYPDYLTWAEKNVRKGGLIMGDNTFLFGQVWLDLPLKGTTRKTLEAMKEFNKRLSDPHRFDATLLPTTEGLTIALKRF